MKREELVIGKSSTAKILILCDFDGTICTVDMGNELLNHFTNDEWEEVDHAYCSGEIGSRDAYSRVSSLFSGTRAELLEFIGRRGVLDLHFPAFYEYCLESGLDLKIVSDGLDIYISAILRKYHLEGIEYFTNLAIFQDGKLSIEFPQMSDECGRCGTCKNGVLNKFRPDYESIIYIGDGHSDFCPSKDADLVFAKGILHKKCMESGRSCEYYENFNDVHDYIVHHISDRLSATAKPAVVGRR
jgi:2-hydroxy-3-keto-5-methylthiopentenyl-1-phosphate phosphatase